MTNTTNAQSAYADADVQRAVDAIDKHRDWSKDWASDTALCIATDVLPAVAPAIAARALRQAAQQILDGYTCDPDVTPRQGDLECVAFDDAIQYLRATADEIEAGR